MKAILLMLAGIPFASANAIEATGEYSRDEMATAYDFACQYVGAEYEDFTCPPPPVTLTTPTRPGLWGFYYRDSAVVWVSDTCLLQPLSIFCEAIAMHEMVHYILSEIDALQPRIDSCRNENLAWSAYNTFVIAHSRDALVNDDWWTAYPNCSGPTADRRTSIREIIEIIIGDSETLLEAL